MTSTASPVTPHLPDANALSPVARLNDAFRASISGADGPPGRVVVTRAVAASGEDFVARALEAVRTFAAFTADNDPNGEHDFGAISVDGVTLWFKIDVYDADYEYGADDPADPVASRRVLTVLLPDDY
jgi:hypothetical protein